MVRATSLMKQAEIAAHSSGRNGGDRRVFDCPAAGVLQTTATATVRKPSAPDQDVKIHNRLWPALHFGRGLPSQRA
jgi:hypothetical protein